MSDQVDGLNAANDQATQHESNGSRGILDGFAPGAFGVMVTTTDVKAMPGIPTIVLLNSDEGNIMAEHHNINMLPVPGPLPPQGDFSKG